MTTTETTTIEATEINPDLENLLRGSSGHLPFSEFGTAIAWTEGAKTQVGIICGYLRGLVAAGKVEHANKLANDFTRQISFLEGYGGYLDDEQAGTFPDGTQVNKVRRYRVQLSNDLTFGGFGVLWYSVVTPEQFSRLRVKDNGDEYDFDEIAKKLRLMRKVYQTQFDPWESDFRQHRSDDQSWHDSRAYYYAFSFNGGLLYHGNGGDEVFSVTLDRCLWSIHT